MLNSQTITNASVQSTGIDMSKFKRAMWIVFSSSLGAAGTLTGQLQSSPNSNFTNNHNISQSNLTTTAVNNGIFTVEVRADQVQGQNAGDRYVRLNLTGAVNAITAWALGLGAEAQQKPAGGNYDLNSTWVTQRVTVNT